MRRAALTAAGLLWAGAAAAAEPRPGEYEVKAAYLYNFAKFVEWPSAARSEFVIGILGRDPFGPLVDRTVAGKTAGDRRLVVRRLAPGGSFEGVDMLFVSAPEATRLPEILQRLNGTPTLTVGDSPDFVGRGGMVGFGMNDDVVRFDLDLDQASRAGLKVSSQLVRVARKVISTGRTR